MNNPNYPPVNPQPPFQPVPPVYAPPAPAAQPVSKKEYYKTLATPETKRLSLISLIVGAVFLLVVILSANATINGSMFKIPVIGLVLGDEFNDAAELYEELVFELEDAIDSEDDEVIEEFEDEYGLDVKKILKIFKNPSINNISKVANALGAPDEVILIYGVVKGLVIFNAIVVLVLAGLGVFFRIKGLVIGGFVYASLYMPLLSGIIYYILLVAAFVALMILISKVNNAYKEYRKSFYAPVAPPVAPVPPMYPPQAF